VTPAEGGSPAIRTDVANLKTTITLTPGAGSALGNRWRAGAGLCGWETGALEAAPTWSARDTCWRNKTGFAMDLDNALHAVVAAKTQLEMLAASKQKASRISCSQSRSAATRNIA